jgi:hypothetical protein
MRSFTSCLTILCTIGLGACDFRSTETETLEGEEVTLQLTRASDGTLQYCDDSGDCVTGLDNPRDCALLEVTIDSVNGATCESCTNADGEEIYASCHETSVACVVVTIPEPDCVVCAYVNGAVLYSSCVAESPDQCDVYYADANGGWSSSAGEATEPVECKRCYDAAGYPIVDECADDCSNVVCPMVLCAEGYAPARHPGECCDHCEPIPNCREALCPQAGFALPECEPGYHLVQDPSSCCAYRCEPSDCSAVACPEHATSECPAGYRWDFTYPNCCGTCVRDENTTPTYCADSLDCPPEQICSDECAFRECDASNGCTDPASPSACYGVCKPADHVCEPYAHPTTECAGYWDSAGRDEYGCPLPPVCYCFDGTISRDGTCPDRCDNVTCADPTSSGGAGGVPGEDQAALTAGSCPTGYHWESGYPYCCGACVPDGQCWTAPDGTTSNGTVCESVTCAAGFHKEIAADCCETCVQDSRHCASSADCLDGQKCSTERGDCSMPPPCEPGTECTNVCYGTCYSF